LLPVCLFFPFSVVQLNIKEVIIIFLERRRCPKDVFLSYTLDGSLESCAEIFSAFGVAQERNWVYSLI
jgi:hypothetical protein